MKKYQIEDLYDEVKDEDNEEAIEYFVNSDIENIVFMSHFIKYDTIFSRKIYWEAFAEIIVRRGLPRVNDILELILQWFQDANWPGFYTIKKFVVKNQVEFYDLYVKTIIHALNALDEAWFYWLIETFKEMKENITQDEINFIDNLLEEVGYYEGYCFKTHILKAKDELCKLLNIEVSALTFR